MNIDAHFPGGNILVDRVDGTNVYLRQDLRDTEGDWFYWYFRVRGAAGKTLNFHFTGSNVIGVRGPAVSVDHGLTWEWLGRGCVEGQSFQYEFPMEAGEARFSFGMPYLQSNLEIFLQDFHGYPDLKVEEMCLSRKGRPVKLLRIGNAERANKRHVVLTCRHHCCEMMASYALEGMITKIFSPDKQGVWLRENTSFLIIPFIDPDGVEDGDQGKNRRPYDHNRDYAGDAIYPEVGALRRFIPEWSGGRLELFLDLHCPWIRGEYNEFVYFVGGNQPGNWQRVGIFSGFLEGNIHGQIPFEKKNNLPFGVGWNFGAEPGQKSSSDWAAELPGTGLSTSIEIPYATASGSEVNSITARAFGYDLAGAMADYLEGLG